MITLAALAGFGLAVTPLVMTPGASFTLVSARGLAGDRAGAWATIIGTAAGIVTHAVLAGVGLAALVLRSAEVYRAVRLVGALYLILLGLSLLWRSRRPHREVSGSGSTASTTNTGRPLVPARRAAVANLLNVKAASVYLTLAPQFVPAAAMGLPAMLSLALVHVAVMAAWLGLWSAGLTMLTVRADARWWRDRIDRVGGVVLITLGLRSTWPPR